MSSTFIGLIVLVVGLAISCCMAPKRELKKPTKHVGPDVYSGDREF